MTGIARSRMIAVLTCLLLAFTAVSVAAAEFSADMVMNMMGRKMQGKLYIKGTKQRMEIQTPGGPMITIIDLKTGKSIMLMPAMKTYSEVNTGPGMSGRTIAGKKDLPPSAKKVGSEKVAGYTCDIYETAVDSGAKFKVWLARKLDYVLRTQGTGPRGGSVLTELKNIREGGVKNSLFAVPSGYRKMAIPGMPGMPSGG